MSYAERGRRRRNRGPSSDWCLGELVERADQRIETSMGMPPTADVQPRWGENLDRARYLPPTIWSRSAG
jgi:hypothetical protein